MLFAALNFQTFLFFHLFGNEAIQLAFQLLPQPEKKAQRLTHRWVAGLLLSIASSLIAQPT